jgi:3-oxoadipate enol-lactonase
MTDRETCVEGEISGDGEAPAFVLLHSLAMDRSIWEPHVDRLATDHPVVTCDLPGHGSSCRIEETSVATMADLVAEYLRSTPYESFVVAGLSLGGCVTQELALRHPDLVAGVCLIDTTASYGQDAVERWEERAQKARNEGFDSLAEFQLARWFSPGFNQANPDVGGRLLDVFRANDIDSYVAACRAMGRFDARSRLGDITVPATVLVGELDPATPPPHAEQLAGSIPDATLRILEGTSHMSPVERPDEIIAALVELRARVVATT